MKKIREFLTRTIWNTPLSKMGRLRRAATSVVRVAYTTVDGVIGKRILVQASSLSYATLLATGPILAITIMFSSMFYRDRGKQFLYEKIIDVATFVMPAFNQMLPPSDTKDIAETESAVKADRAEAHKAISGAANSGGESGAEELSAERAKINPQIFEFIDNVSKGSRGAGAVGVITMLVTCVLLCVNMESSFNYIWGIRQGRPFWARMVFYFTLVFFGSVGTIFGMTFLATSHLSAFMKDIPVVSEYAPWITYFLGIGVMTLVLAFFYQFIPRTNVKWSAAFVGAVIVMALLLLNNKMSFIYISYIVKQQSFYGYFAIVAVAMFSLYIFWVMILAGGLITYAVQYVDFLSDDEAWLKMGMRARDCATLAVYAVVARSFVKREPEEATVESIALRLMLPKLAVISALSRLEREGLVCVAQNASADGDKVECFKPSHSPENLSIAGFADTIANASAVGNDALVVEKLSRSEPVVAAALAARAEYAQSKSASQSIASLL